MYIGRILILEDDAQVGRILKRIAASSGFEARLLADPRRFLRAVETWHPTHIALDLVMPKMDGEQVLTELAKRGCAAQIIIISGVHSRVLEAASRAAQERGLHIRGALTKPFSTDSLQALLSAPPAERSA